jgi:hypothetical protein
MNPRKLNLLPDAVGDFERRLAYLLQQRGYRFARSWGDDLLTWLEQCATNGAVMGTAHPMKVGTRTFPYRNQATILAEYTESDLWIIRLYFPGQDWLD